MRLNKTKLYETYMKYPRDDYSIALQNLDNAYASKDDAQLEGAFYKIAAAMSSDDLKNAVKNIKQFSSPVITQFINNLQNWYSIFNSHTEMEDVILALHRSLLDFALEDYVKQQHDYCVKMEKATGLPFKFSGIELLATQESYSHYEQQPKKPLAIANKIMEILIARGILEGAFYDKLPGYNDPVSFGAYSERNYMRWYCTVVDAKRLEQLSRETFEQEIYQASELITKITGRSCQMLMCSPHEDERHYKFLERKGAFKLNGNSRIDDYNLTILEQWCAQDLTIAKLWDLEEKSVITNTPTRPVEIQFTIGDHFHSSWISFKYLTSMRMTYLIEEITKNSQILAVYLPHPHEKITSLEVCLLNIHFEELFKHPEYFTWKAKIFANLPELTNQFAEFEDKAAKTKELFRLDKLYKDKVRHQKMSLFKTPTENNINELKEQRDQLFKELYGSSDLEIIDNDEEPYTQRGLGSW